MYKKVIYVVKSDLHYYPPCVSQIRLLNQLGVNVEVWFGSSNESALNIFDHENIPYECIGEKFERKGTFRKILSWYDFRKRIKLRLKNMETEARKLTVFWFGTTETVIPLIGYVKSLNYIVTSLELLDDKKNRIKRKLFGKIASRSKAVISCEETRSYIMRYWYSLNNLPYTLPNKPFSLEVKKNTRPSCTQTKTAIEKIKDKKFIIYQGIFQNIDYLSALAQALKIMNSDYYLVLMGFDIRNGKTVEKLKDIYDKVIHIESLPAPLHLEVTSYARIGIAFYDGTTLNKAFCAPNKIYEYSGFGIPVLANNIPGLLNTIGKSGAGECIDFKPNSIIKAIERIEKSYNTYSNAALKFYNSTDNLKTMKKIVIDNQIEMEKDRV